MNLAQVVFWYRSCGHYHPETWCGPLFVSALVIICKIRLH